MSMVHFLSHKFVPESNTPLATSGTGVQRVVGTRPAGAGVVFDWDGGRREVFERHREPGVPQDLLQGGSVGGTHAEALSDQVSAFCWKGTSC